MKAVVDVADANTRTVARVIITSCVVLAMLTALGTVLTYRHLNGNLTSVPGIEEIDDRPAVLYEGDGRPLNILVMGSDSREGEDNDIDGEDPANGARSDTTVILHMSADRESAYGISIPRDSVVDRPDCGDDNEIAGEEDAKWNAAFSLGGPLCAVEQVEQSTGIRVDDFVVIDFNGFKEMVDAVGGVEICVPEEINDPAKQIFVPAGTNELRGDQALDYVRVRDNVGSESDLGRIKRQQNFMASMINKVVSSGTLTRPDRVIKFLSAATGSLVTSEGLDSVRELGDLALQLRSTGLGQIRFVTVPWEYEPDYDVLWLPAADDLFESTIMDRPLSSKLSSDAIDAGRPRGSEEGSTEELSEAAENGLCS